MNSRKLALLAAALALPACEEDINDDSTAPAVTRRISLAADGSEGDRASSNPDLTPDGRYAVFDTAAALVAEDTNGKVDIYRKDLLTGAIVLVSVNDLGEPGDGDSTRPSISADGSRVAFQSFAVNLASGDTDQDASTSDIYVRDLAAGTTLHVSQAEGGGPAFATNGSSSPAISGDGLYVAFASDAEDLQSAAPILNPTTWIYRVEIDTGLAEMVTVTTLDEAAEAESDRPSISFDGAWVAFDSSESGLVDGDVNGTSDVFVRDMSLGSTERIGGNGPSSEARLSPDGRYLAFTSAAFDLVPGDVNGLPDVFLRDRQALSTTKVSASVVGGGAAGQSSLPVVSADGRYVAFLSEAPNLVPGDANNVRDHFLRDLATGATYRVSVRTGGAPGTDTSEARPALTADGRFVAFASRAPELVVGDSNGDIDVFLRGPNY